MPQPKMPKTWRPVETGAGVAVAPAVPDLDDELGGPGGEPGAPPAITHRPLSASDVALGMNEDEETVVSPPSDEEQTLADFAVEARVVYLGSRPKMAIYLEGALEEYTDEEGRTLYRAVPVNDMALSYNFDRLGTDKRPVRERRTRDGRPFAICRHIGHLALFQRMRDRDGQPMFRVQAKPAVTRQIEEYLERLRKMPKNLDRGKPLLQAMGLAG